MQLNFFREWFRLQPVVMIQGEAPGDPDSMNALIDQSENISV